MKVLVNENQYKQILLESFTEEILKGIKESEKLITGLIENSENNFGFNVEGLTVSNTNIGGLLSTVDEYIIEEFDKISDNEKKLILTGLIVLFFSSDEEIVYKTLLKIKEERLSAIFKKIYNKALELKESFENYLSHLKLTGQPEIYYFMIPYAPVLLNTNVDIVFDNKLANKLSLLSGLDFEKTKDLIEKLISSRTSDSFEVVEN